MTPEDIAAVAEDREAAWPIWKWVAMVEPEHEELSRLNFMDGDFDEHFIVQAFATQRVKHEAEIAVLTNSRDTAIRLAAKREASELAAVALLAEAREVIAPFAERSTCDEAMAAGDSAFAGIDPEQRIEMIGKRKREHDAAILKARAFMERTAK